ncbi:hypothetical protein [Mycobacterium sp.]|uniref:hypothetical protein n=1 Tax=Mycobacterium sp. TaxID=1785 RepID=UPI002CACD98B|nr:hypothetical protein [Mycobacterium sp.]HME49599.1 hypothetical protein [Mycobacterium sp.]
MTTKGPTKTAFAWRRSTTAALASTGMAVMLMLGSSPGLARADVLDDLAKEFTTASGAGPVANLVNQSLRLRAMGFMPTKGELDSITQAETYRPNQTPLIKALQETVAGQAKLQQESQALGGGQNQVGFGINQYDPNNPGGLTAGPGGVNLGGGSNQYIIGGGKPVAPGG